MHKITLKNLFSQRPKYILCGSFVDAIERITKNKSPRKKSYIAMLETIGAQNIDDKYWAGFSRSHHININQPNTINTTAYKWDNIAGAFSRNLDKKDFSIIRRAAK